MRIYELTYLISSEIPEEEAQGIQEKLASFLQEKEGLLIEKSKILRKRLAYPVKKSANRSQSQGADQSAQISVKKEQTQVYLAYLVFQLKPEILADLEMQLDREENVLRFLIVVKKPGKPVKESRKPRIFPQPEKEIVGEASQIQQPMQDKKKKVELKEIDKTIEEILSE